MVFKIENKEVITQDPLITMENALSKTGGDYTLLGEELTKKATRRLKNKYEGEFIVVLPHNSFYFPYMQLLSNLMLWHSIHKFKKMGLSSDEVVLRVNSEGWSEGYEIRKHPIENRTSTTQKNIKNKIRNS